MIKIITDTTAGLPAEIAEKYGIPVVPQIVTFGDESFYEGIELDNDAFLARLRASPELPKTSAPPPELFAQEFARWVPSGIPILCIHPSADVSGTVRSASVAALDFPGADIRVIDTRVVASPLATLVQLAAEWAAAGEDIDTVETRLKAMIPRSRIYFLVATLEYLQKGGRIGGASALIGTMLQIKPILELRNGRVEPLEKVRTHRQALERLKELVIEQCPRDPAAHLSVMNAGEVEAAERLAHELASTLGAKHVPIYNVGASITTHGGPGILAVAFFV